MTWKETPYEEKLRLLKEIAEYEIAQELIAMFHTIRPNEFPDEFYDAVCDDIYYASDWEMEQHFNSSDVRIAIERVLMKGVMNDLQY